MATYDFITDFILALIVVVVSAYFLILRERR